MDHDERHSSDSREMTADALVAAGRDLFARHGYDGASVRAITAKAGANLGAITYHFGSKRTLYDRVIEGAVQPLVEGVEAAGRGPGASLDRLEAVVRVYFEHLGANPDLPRLMMQEMVVGPPSPVTMALLRRALGVLAAVVREGQAAGSIRPGDPVILGLGIISQPVHIGLARRAFLEVAGVDLGDPARWQAVVDNAVLFARAGLAARTEEETA